VLDVRGIGRALYEKELPKIQEELIRLRKHEKKAQMLREQLERHLQEQIQVHIANMTIEGATGSSSNTTVHSTTSRFLHGAGCLRQGVAATSSQQSAAAAVSSQQLNSSSGQQQQQRPTTERRDRR
jgi:hypothetical protein